MNEHSGPEIGPRESIADVAARLETEFAALEDWGARVAHVLALGRALEGLPPDRRMDENKVKGCQSQVWLIIDHDRQRGRLRLAADSDALVMRGLLALVLRLYGDRRPDEILDHPPDVLDRLALVPSLAPNRANGLHLVVKRIKAVAAALQDRESCAQGEPHAT